MDYKVISNYRKDDELRRSFNALAERTFGLSFENWYQNGFWNDKYIPYSILLDGNIIANVSVNIINCEVKGKKRRYIRSLLMPFYAFATLAQRHLACEF